MLPTPRGSIPSRGWSAEMRCALVLSLFSAVSADVFSALVHVETAFLAERDLAADVRNYIRKEEGRLKELSKLADLLEEHSVAARSRQTLESHLLNPVTAYATIRDLHDGATQVEHHVHQATANSKEFYNVSVVTSELVPTDADLANAATALFRLQDTYEIPAYKLADGEFLDESFGTVLPLTVKDLIAIGKVAYAKKDYYHASTWLLEAMERLPEDASNDTKFDVLDHLAYALYKQGNSKRALHLTDQVIALRPGLGRVVTNRDYFLAELGNTAYNGYMPPLKLTRHLEGYQAHPAFAVYEQLCRGENVKPLENPDTLVCRYTTNGGNPMLMYAPAKEEVLNRNPLIVFYHQVLSDFEVELIKNISIPKLHRSGVFADTGTDAAKDYRTSKSAWLGDDVHPVIRGMSNRIAAITGLSLATAEPLQVVNYGIGGHYEPHRDFVDEYHEFTSVHGNRLATFISYLSEVPAGGATAFPMLGINIWPEKGGAALWYNLHRDGTGDERTVHAACPVLSGYKWVANKWIHEAANEFVRPCSLQPDH